MAIRLDNQPTNLTEYPNSFKRQGPFPLELYEIYQTLSAAQSYARTSGVAYVGQRLIVDDGDTVTLYIIKNEAGDLQEYCSKSEIDFDTIEIDGGTSDDVI